jgi:glyoxylase-like metal-dependent hydrolase (beta-lactamase superfamily II)
MTRQATLYAQSREVDVIAKQIGMAPAAITPLEHGQRMQLGESAHLEIVHTPGHSPGSICIRVLPTVSRQLKSTQELLLSGDTLFPGSCGRLDAPDSSVDGMHASLGTLRGLGADVKVYPGHGYSGESTTVGHERVEGLLQPFTREGFATLFAK